MPSDTPVPPSSNGAAKPDPGLPTVTPPTGGMFLRLFGVPALIVGGLVLLLIVAQPLIGRATKFLLGHAWAPRGPRNSSCMKSTTPTPRCAARRQRPRPGAAPR